MLWLPIHLIPPLLPAQALTATKYTVDVNKLHHHLGHVCESHLHTILKEQGIKWPAMGLAECVVCQQGKATHVLVNGWIIEMRNVMFQHSLNDVPTTLNEHAEIQVKQADMAAPLLTIDPINLVPTPTPCTRTSFDIMPPALPPTTPPASPPTTPPVLPLTMLPVSPLTTLPVSLPTTLPLLLPTMLPLLLPTMLPLLLPTIQPTGTANHGHHQRSL